MFRISSLLDQGCCFSLQVETPFGWYDVYTISDYPTLKMAVHDWLKNKTILQIADENGNKLESSF